MGVIEAFHKKSGSNAQTKTASTMMTVYDCFMYNGEQSALAEKLAIPNVDRRVIVESWLTHSGLQKPALYYNSKLPGVQHVVADLTKHSDPWARENAQRNAILVGLRDAEPDDIVIIGDADEIASSDGIERGKAALSNHDAVVLCQTSYNYSRAWHDPGGWRGPVMTTVKHARLQTPQGLRDLRENLPRIPDAGEHLSWFGGESEVVRKIQSFAHQEFSTAPDDVESLRARMAGGEDLFGRWRLMPTEGTSQGAQK